MDSLDSFPNMPKPQEVKINDYIADYLIESNQECFRICVKDFKLPDVSKNEMNCINNCYAKYFGTFINVSDKIKNKTKKE